VRERRQVLGEPRVEPCRGVEAPHVDAVARGKPGDRAEHGQAVVAVRVERAAAQTPPASRRRRPVRAGLDLGVAGQHTNAARPAGGKLAAGDRPPNRARVHAEARGAPLHGQTANGSASLKGVGRWLV
jgi:ribosomal protein L15E